MTYAEIYNQICMYVWGDTGLPTNMGYMLIGSEGIVAQARKQIQEDYDYWFMEATHELPVIASDSTYDLDFDNFKKEIRLWFEDENGDYVTPLTKLSKNEQDQHFTDADQEVKYPTHYYIDYNSSTGYRRLNLYPIPEEDRTLHIRYYRYLDLLSDIELTWNTTEDNLSIEAPSLLIWTAIRDITNIHTNLELLAMAENNIARELTSLKNKDWQYQRANTGRIRYSGL